MAASSQPNCEIQRIGTRNVRGVELSLKTKTVSWSGAALREPDDSFVDGDREGEPADFVSVAGADGF